MNKNRKVLSRLTSVILALAICITMVFGCAVSASADTDYVISGVNVVYEYDGTMSINVHIPSAVEGERLVITKVDGSATKYTDIDISDATMSSYAGVSLPETAKMYTLKNLSATDLNDELVFTRVVDEVCGTSQTFSVEDYAMLVITEDESVYYPDSVTTAQKTADKEMAAAFVNYVSHAANALSAKNAASSNTDQLDTSITSQLEKVLYDTNGEELLTSWSLFSADNAQFKADEFSESDEDITVYGTGLNLKGNPYLHITFSIKGKYADDKENLVATFTAGDQEISVKGSEMTNNSGAGRYHLVRLKGITVNNLCKDVNLSVTYNGVEVLYGTFGVAGFVNAANNAQIEEYALVGKSILYYCNVIDARNIIKIQSTPTAFAVYGESFDAEGNSLGNSLNFYNRIADDIGSKITFDDGSKQVVTALYKGITSANTVPWSAYASTVNLVNVIDEGVAPNKVDYWFDGFSDCTSIDLTNLDTSNVDDMSTLFSGCDALETLTLGENFGTSEQTLADTGIDNSITGFTKASEDDAADYYCSKISLGTAETYTAVTYCYATIWSNQGNNPHLRLYQRKYVPEVNEVFEDYTVGGVYAWRGDTVSAGCLSPKDSITGETLQSWDEAKPIGGLSGKLTDGIKKVTVVDNIAPQSLYYWFDSFFNCTEFNLENLDVTAATSMTRMFFGCSKVTSLDLSNFDTSNITSMYRMFRSCETLKEIFVTDKFVVNSVSSSADMFYNCLVLEGGNGTVWESDNATDKTYALIDGVDGNRGYFTATPHKHNVESWTGNSDTTHIGVCTVYNEPITEEHSFVNGECKCGYTQNSDGEISTAFAVYGESFDIDGNSLGMVLNFYNRTAYELTVGSTIALDDGSSQTVAEIYTGITATSAVPWSTHAAEIKQVKVVDNFAPSYINYWFENFTACTLIDLAKLDTSNVGAMSTLITNCDALETLILGKNFGTASQNLTDIGIDKYITGFTKASEEDATDYYCSEITLGTAETYTAVTYSYAMVWFDGSYTNPYMSIYQRKYVPQKGETFDSHKVTAVFAWCDYTVSEGCRAPRNYTTGELCQSWNTAKPVNSAYGLLTDGIEKITVVDKIAPQSLENWFSDFINCKSIDVANLDTSNATSLSGMFYNCSKLTTLDLSSFDTANVTNMDNMFNKCRLLKTIIVSDKFVTDSVTSSTNMFYGCTVLTGANGTTVSGLTHEYACIDGVDGKNGYFTAVSEGE